MANASITVSGSSNKVGGPKQVCGYFTASMTSTQETISLSDYGAIGINFLSVTVSDTATTTPSQMLKSWSFSTSSLSATITHATQTAETATIYFTADVY